MCIERAAIGRSDSPDDKAGTGRRGGASSRLLKSVRETLAEARTVLGRLDGRPADAAKLKARIVAASAEADRIEAAMALGRTGSREEPAARDVVRALAGLSAGRAGNDP